MSARHAGSAVYALWLNESEWRDWDAGWLLAGFEPPYFNEHDIGPEGIFRLIAARRKSGDLCADKITPVEWINWAHNEGLTIPAELLHVAELRALIKRDKPKLPLAKTRKPTKADAAKLVTFARGLMNERGHGPTRDEMLKFGQRERLPRSWTRKEIKNLPSDIQKSRGRRPKIKK